MGEDLASSPWLRGLGIRKAERAPRDAIDQSNLGKLQDRIKEHRFHLRLAWGCAGINGVVAAIAVAGCIYLGTLPKSVVEWELLDPHGFPLKAYAREVLSESEIQQTHELLIGRFLKGLREIYPFDKDHQNAIMRAAAKMTKSDSPAWKKADAYFKETLPYERQKKESVVLDLAFSFQENPATWRMTFCEEVRSLNSIGAQRSTEYNVTIFTEIDNSRQGRKATPLGLFIHDYHVSDGKAVQSCAR